MQGLWEHVGSWGARVGKPTSSAVVFFDEGSGFRSTSRLSIPGAGLGPLSPPLRT